MPTWDEVAEKQRETLQGAGVVASDAGAIAALLAGKAGRVQLALLDRSDLASDDWRKVFLLGRLPAMGMAPNDWSLNDEDGDVLDEPPDTPGGLLLHERTATMRLSRSWAWATTGSRGRCVLRGPSRALRAPPSPPADRRAPNGGVGGGARHAMASAR